MAYEHLYQFYDALMEDVPYNKYIEVIKKWTTKTDLILDLGCGTGTVLCQLLKEGYLVEGMDISEDMLLITQEKLQDLQLMCPLYQDDMRQLSIEGEYDCVMSFLDVINYLTTREDVLSTFQNVYLALKDEGVFVFDVHTLNKVKNVFDGYCFNAMEEKFSYLWNTYVEEFPTYSTVTHELAFFLKQQNGFYRQLREYHEQVVFPLQVYIELLEQVGFEITSILYDFTLDKTEDTCNKMIVIAKKCKS